MTGPRSLADDLGRRSQADLAELFLARPDLLDAAPADFSVLAGLAGGRVSVTRAIAGLDAAHLLALTAVAIADGPTDPAQLPTLGPRAGELVADLWRLALVWGTPTSVRVLSAAREVVLGPEVLPRLAVLVPNVAELAGDPEELARLLERAPRAVRERLATITAEFPTRPKASGSAGGPLTWLAEHGVLVPVGRQSLVLPTELALVLGDLQPGPDFVTWTLDPPAVDGDVDAGAVAQSAAAAASAAVDLMGHLLDWLAAAQPGVLRSGGMGVRDTARMAAALGCDLGSARVLIELAGQLGLVGQGPPGDTQRDGQAYLPTEQLADWAGLDLAGRWAAMALAWLRMPRRTYPLEGEAKLANVLTAELAESRMGRQRRFALSMLDGLGAVPPDDFLTLVGWHRPLQYSQDHRTGLRALLAEAQLLAVVARDCLTGPGRALLAIPEPEQPRLEPGRLQPPRAPSLLAVAEAAEPAAAVMRALLPQPVSEIVVQTDLTVVVPGPPVPELTQFLADVADVESRGAATVLRVSPHSLRRALERGQTAAQLLAGFTRWSATSLPQPLGHLIDEVQRNFGRLRVGSAQSFLLSQDAGTLEVIAADRGLAGLGLVVVAPTVAVSSARREELLAGLTRAGYAAVAQAADGELVAVAAPRATEPVAASRMLAHWELPASRELAEQLASHLKLASQPPSDADLPAQPTRIPGLPAADLVVVLAGAVRSGEPVWVDQTDRFGSSQYQLIWPIQVSGGRVLARTQARQVTRIPLSRLAGAVPAAPNPS